MIHVAWLLYVVFRFNSLIDTGALVTGLSNFQVAAYLLKKGLPVSGVTYLDARPLWDAVWKRLLF